MAGIESDRNTKPTPTHEVDVPAEATMPLPTRQPMSRTSSAHQEAKTSESDIWYAQRDGLTANLKPVARDYGDESYIGGPEWQEEEEG